MLQVVLQNVGDTDVMSIDDVCWYVCVYCYVVRIVDDVGDKCPSVHEYQCSMCVYITCEYGLFSVADVFMRFVMCVSDVAY